MKHAFPVTLFFILLTSSLGFAETREIIAEGTYNMGDGETPSVAESRALLNAKQIALEQAGTYVESYSKVKNITLTQDEVRVLASGLLEVEILDKKRTIVGDGINFWLKIKAKVTLDKMEDMAKRVKDKSMVEDYKKIQEAYARSQSEIEELKKQLLHAKDQAEKRKVEERIREDEKFFKANEWLEKGRWHQASGLILNPAGLDKALDAYNKAIALSPKLALAYSHRCLVYAAKGQFEMALTDCNKAIALSPDNAKVYFARGGLYKRKRAFDKAVKDYSRAIAIDPKNDAPYLARGGIYEEKRQYELAISDYGKAIEFSSSDFFRSIYYNLRGWCYFGVGQYDRAIKDFNEAITLDPNFAEAHIKRGITHLSLKQYDLAINDFSVAMELNPDLSDAYVYRGLAYSLVEDADRAISDLEKSCGMGSKKGCELLKIISDK